MRTAAKVPFHNLTIFILICVSSLVSVGFVPYPEDEYPPRPTGPRPIQLDVKPLQQKKITSCGQAAITMAYNYAHPDSPLEELDVIAFAMEYGYYVDNRRPFTSPAGMFAIANHYTESVQTGAVTTPDEGLKLLSTKLHNNQPVIIDIWTYLDVPYSDAHFVVVTGISMHERKQGVYIIHYNDPLTARTETARWDGQGGIWEAWLRNGDPGGSGWWMTLPSSE